MSLFVTALNSGSNGNCFYIGNDHEAILIDAGISCRETERRMMRLGLSMKKGRGIFISHEHTDPVRDVRVLSWQDHLPVYNTPGTLVKGHLSEEDPLHRLLSPHQPVAAGNLSITAFPKHH